MTTMTNGTNGAGDVPVEQRCGILFEATVGARYLIPEAVLAACRVEETQLAALRAQDDVQGYFREYGLRDYVNYLLAESTYLASNVYASVMSTYTIVSHDFRKAIGVHQCEPFFRG